MNGWKPIKGNKKFNISTGTIRGKSHLCEREKEIVTWRFWAGSAEWKACLVAEMMDLVGKRWSFILTNSVLLSLLYNHRIITALTLNWVPEKLGLKTSIRLTTAKYLSGLDWGCKNRFDRNTIFQGKTDAFGRHRQTHLELHAPK